MLKPKPGERDRKKKKKHTNTKSNDEDSDSKECNLTRDIECLHHTWEIGRDNTTG